MGEKMPQREIDRYWLKQGESLLESLTESLRVELTPKRQESLMHYLGGVLNLAYDMGISLGRLQVETEQKGSQCQN